MSDRVCIIHIGTHKTGTTSQQTFLAQNRALLLQGGILYAESGWYQGLTGTHQVAWELLGSDESPNLDHLIAELRATNAHTAILSSEDFCLLYARPRALEVLSGAIRAAGFTPRILVYLRSQPQYAESIYVERVKANYIRSVDSYLDEIYRTGRYIPEQTPISLEFCYTRLLAPWVNVFGRENVEARAYRTSEDLTHIFRDFLSAAAKLAPRMNESPLQLSISRPRENDSLTFFQLLATTYDKLRPARPIADPRMFAQAFAPEVPPELFDQRFALFRRAEWLRFLEFAAQDNAEIAREFGAEIPFLSETDVPVAEDPRWAKAEVERPIYDRCLELWLRKTA